MIDQPLILQGFYFAQKYFDLGVDRIIVDRLY